MMEPSCYITRFSRKETEYDIFLVRDGQGKPCELFCQKTDRISSVGNIYVGKTERVVPQIGGAFVRIGPDTSVFLPLEDAKNCMYTHKFAKKEDLCGGDELLVEIVKDPIKTKDAVATGNLTFASEHLLLTTGKRQIGVSRKLPETERQKIKEALAELEGEFGFVVRTNAAGISAEELQAEASSLWEETGLFLETSSHREAYALVRESEHPFLGKAESFLRRYPQGNIRTDLPGLFEDMQKKFESQKQRIVFYQDESYPLYKLTGLPTILERALSRKVYLSSGAYLVIDPTEALTVIDVNSGKRQGKNDAEEYYYRINLEAAAEIARQLRLRNISGMILVDFINMDSKEHCEEVLTALRRFCADDPDPVQVLDYTRLHLVEMTRKKQYVSLAQQME